MKSYNKLGEIHSYGRRHAGKPGKRTSYLDVRTQKYKYVEFERGRNPLLFNIERDPEELHNLYNTQEGGKILPELRALTESIKKMN